MSDDDKARAERPAAAQPEPWDSAKTVSPDPSWPAEVQLHWYKVASHVLLLNCSETVRVAAARAADREVTEAGLRLAARISSEAPTVIGQAREDARQMWRAAFGTDPS